MGIGLLLLANHHLGESIGDSLLRAVGISPWTGKYNSGFHLPVLPGFALLVIGIIGTARFYRPRYPKIMSRLVIGSIAFFIVLPNITETTMFFVKHETKGTLSLDVTNVNCDIRSDGNEATADCQFKLYNYGKADRISIKPVLQNEFSRQPAFEFESNILTLDPHSKHNLNMRFVGIQRNEEVGSSTGYWRGTKLVYEVL